MPAFWKLLTNEGSYNSSSAKASSLIHPVIKVAHRILCCIFFPQEEVSKVGQKELELLWCMVNEPAITPHFGNWVLHKLLKVARTGGKENGRGTGIHCGGLITAIAKQAGVRFYEGLATVRGEPALTIGVYTTMGLLRHSDSTRTTVWRYEGDDYLQVTSANRSILDLSFPVSTTDWIIESNLGAEIPQPPPQPEHIALEPPQHQHQHDQPSFFHQEHPSQPPPSHSEQFQHASTSQTPPFHFTAGSSGPQPMDFEYQPYFDREFGQVYTRLDGFQTNLTGLRTDFTDYNTHDTNRFNTLNTGFTEFHESVNNQFGVVQRNMGQLNHMMTAMLRLQLGDPNYQPPPPGPHHP